MWPTTDFVSHSGDSTFRRSQLLAGRRRSAASRSRRSSSEQTFPAQYEQARDAYPDLGEVSRNTIIGLIGGINELVERELERGVNVADG